MISSGLSTELNGLFNLQELALWDIPFYSGVARRQLTGPGEDFSAYFSLGACMEGLDLLFRTLYGIRLEPSPLKPGEAWNNDIYKIEVIHESDGFLGTIFCDFYDRPRKPHQDCHFTIVGGKELSDGTYQVFFLYELLFYLILFGSSIYSFFIVRILLWC